MAATNANSLNESVSGFQAMTSSGVFNGRTITGTANQIAVANGDGSAGNPTLSLTSTIQVSGISFDSGSNTLSAYSTGTFSPTLTGSGGNPTVSYTTQAGFYEKIGTKVIINSQIALSAYSGGTGNVQLDSLPFTSSATSNSQSVGTVGVISTTFGASVLYYVYEVSVNASFGLVPGIVSAAGVTNLAVTGPGASSSYFYSCAYNI